MKPLILVGAGGHCKSVIEAAESSSRSIYGVLDLPQNIGNDILGYKVIGSDEQIAQYTSHYEFVVTVGHIKESSTRERLHHQIERQGGSLATIIASTAHVSRHAKIGPGSVVLHGAMINAGATVGKGCIVNTLANIEHDAVVGDFCHISTGAMVNGQCVVGQGVFLGSQSVITNGATIAPHCVVAAGSFVRKALTIRGIYAGNPALVMKKL